MLFVVFDLAMAVIMFLIGLYFYKSKGNVANLLTGYNMRSDKERKQFNEAEMCRSYGVRLMIMAIPFLVGTVIDVFFPGKGCLLAWIAWTILLILLLVKRTKIEK